MWVFIRNSLPLPSFITLIILSSLIIIGIECRWYLLTFCLKLLLVWFQVICFSSLCEMLLLLIDIYLFITERPFGYDLTRQLSLRSVWKAAISSIAGDNNANQSEKSPRCWCCKAWFNLVPSCHSFISGCIALRFYLNCWVNRQTDKKL